MSGKSKPPSYGASYKAYPTAKYYDEDPLCSKNTSNKPWCLEDDDYPLYEVQAALDQHYQAVQALYKVWNRFFKKKRKRIAN